MGHDTEQESTHALSEGLRILARLIAKAYLSRSFPQNPAPFDEHDGGRNPDEGLPLPGTQIEDEPPSREV